MVKQMLLSDWSFMRVLRLGMGLLILVQAIQMHDTLTGFFGAFFLFQAVTNTGCCGASGCAAPMRTDNTSEVQNVEFEEVVKK